MRAVRELRRTGSSVLLGSLAVGGLLSAAASQSLVLAILCLGLAGLLLLVTLFGIEGAGIGIIWLGVFFAPENSIRPTSAASFVTIADLLFVLGFMVLVPVMLQRRLRVPPLWALGVIIMVSMGFIASLTSPDASLSLNHMLRFMVAVVFFPIAFMYWQPSRRIVGALATAYYLGTAVSVAAAVLHGPDAATGRYDGLTTHYNFFGLTGLLAFCATPYVAAMARPRLRWMVWIGGLVGLYGVWLSGSRAALLVAVAVAVAYPIVERSLKGAAALYAAGVAGLAFSSQILSSSGSNALGRLLGDESASYADVQRHHALQVALQMFHDHPLGGNGFAAALEAHDIYLEVAVSVGVIGVFGYLLIFWSMIAPLFTRKGRDHLLAYPALGYALVGLITNALWDRFIWGILALTLVVTVLPREETADRSPGTDPDLDRLADEPLVKEPA